MDLGRFWGELKKKEGSHWASGHEFYVYIVMFSFISFLKKITEVYVCVCVCLLVCLLKAALLCKSGGLYF